MFHIHIVTLHFYETLFIQYILLIMWHVIEHQYCWKVYIQLYYLIIFISLFFQALDYLDPSDI